MACAFLLRARLSLIGLVCSWCSVACAQTDAFALRSGDAVVFYGDSITAQHLYTRYTEDFTITRYPGLDVRFVNAGVPGDTVSGGYAGSASERVSRDVTPFYPTMITVMLGMNDGGWGYTPQATMLANFEKGYRSLLDTMRASSARARFTLITPTPYDEITHGTEFPAYNHLIDELSKAVSRMQADRQQASTPKTLHADFNAPMQSALACAHKRFPQLAPLLVPDRIHPGEVAHWMMASALMKAWGVNPIVSELSIDASTALVNRTNRTTVSEIQRKDTGISWTQQDDALPLPLDLNNALTPVLLDCSEIAELDQQMLRISGLHMGTYDLWIDGKKISSYSAAELVAGVNLALQKTPMLAQARGIDWLEERRAALDQAKLVLKADVKQTEANESAQERLSAAQDELAVLIREKTKPTAHTFEVKLQ